MDAEPCAELLLALPLRFSRPQPWGLVEIFDQEQIFGWAHVPDGQPTREVSLHLNEDRLTATMTAAVLDRDLPFRVCQFRFRLNELWRYARVDDRITVRLDGAPLHIVGHDRERRPAADGDLPKEQLLEKLASGHVFNQKGIVQLSKGLDLKWQKTVFALYDEVRAFLKERFDLDLMVIYGTLLGAIRSGKLIGQDHDFDVGYFSHRTDRAEVKAEAVSIIHALASEGYSVRIKNACFYVGHAQHGSATIDIGRLFFDKHGNLKSAFGFASMIDFRRDDFHGYQEVDLEGRKVLTVDAPDKLLACIYGEGWRIPNPGFHWIRERKRAVRAARFDEAEMASLTADVRRLAPPKTR